MLFFRLQQSMQLLRQQSQQLLHHPLLHQSSVLDPPVLLALLLLLVNEDYNFMLQGIRLKEPVAQFLSGRRGHLVAAIHLSIDHCLHSLIVLRRETGAVDRKGFLDLATLHQSWEEEVF